MVNSASITRALSGLDPSDLMGGDQDALADFIAEYLDEQDETSEGKPRVVNKQCYFLHKLLHNVCTVYGLVQVKGMQFKVTKPHQKEIQPYCMTLTYMVCIYLKTTNT